MADKGYAWAILFAVVLQLVGNFILIPFFEDKHCPVMRALINVLLLKLADFGVCEYICIVCSNRIIKVTHCINLVLVTNSLHYMLYPSNFYNSFR